MSLINHHFRVVASVLFALAAFGAAPAASFEQGAMGTEAQRRSAEFDRLRTEQRRSLERSMAHARMPDTMYASTPDPAPPPHPVPFDVKRSDTPERPTPLVPASPPTASPGHRVPLFVSASGASGSQGVARIINRSDASGEVRIEGFDDAGVRHGPVRLRLGAGEAVHLSAVDLERGNAAKGLVGRLGRGEGDWRLELASALDLEVLGYVRTRDGFLTAMHDVVAPSEAGHRVVLFNPGRNVAQASRLRIVNPGVQAAEVRIEGIDDAGAASGGAVEVTVPAQGARTLTARALESGGPELVGALGAGTGRWRLLVTADRPVEAMSLIASASGYLVNVSTAPGAVGSGGSGASTVHRVAWLPAAVRWTHGGVQGFVRIVNHSRDTGEVRIEAFDDAGVQAGVVTVAIGSREAVEFTSAELESGNAAMGLSGGIGAGEGDWWLRLSTSLEVEVLAYVQAQDGLVSSVHDVVPRAGGVHRVRVFNPASETSQTSRLRLVNPGTQAAKVRIEGIDDAGVSSHGAVTLTLGVGAARTLSAEELESGEGVSGGLGDGTGRWRLEVSADTAIEVMSPLASPIGHVANLSTAPGAVVSETTEEVFAARISGPVVQAKCVACHTARGVAGATRLHFEPASNPAHQALNLKVFEDFVAEVDDGADYILNKMQGVGHGGGVQVAAGTPEFTAMERFLELLGEDVTPVALTPQTLFDTVRMAPLRKTLRRAALIFAGRTPTDEEYAAAQRGGTAAREAIRGLMTGPEFHEFLTRGANDRLLTDRDHGAIINHHGFVDFKREEYRRAKAAYESGNERELWEWHGTVRYGASRAPTELIAHVVENDLPYTEILTADYIMANPWTAAAYGAPTHHFDDPTDFAEFKPSRIETYYRVGGDGFEVEYDPVLDLDWIVDPGPLITEYPHAGILNTTVFLQRYPTTATNRNRARARWTYYHFLGLDVEKSASRTTDPVALADPHNPTRHNSACTVCHSVLDPVAGAFQNYGDNGYYRDQWGGLDSLDEHYKDEQGEELEIRAASRENREALTWTVSLAAGLNTLRVEHTNDFWRGDILTGGHIYLDRLNIIDAQGRMLVRRELEDLEPPVTDRGNDCADRRGDYLHFWSGHRRECVLFVDVEVPEAGVYTAELVGWASRHEELYEQEHGDRFAQVVVVANPYREGDTWYRDMRPPGFAGEQAPDPDNSVQWLAEQIVADPRFAEATVKFWWPALMGSEVAEPPEEVDDADFEGRLLAANAQDTEVQRLARGFRYGFPGGEPYDLKDLLVEMVLSKWFRADAMEDSHPARQVALRGAGAKRLLTPEELARKTAAVTGVQWGRRIGTNAYDGRWPNELTGEFRLLYGGIDSDGIPERSRDMTTVMASVARTHATRLSCPIVMRELYLLPDAERRLFSGIDTNVTPISELSASFDIESRSRTEKETLSLNGALSAGNVTVRLAYTNDYWEPGADRNVYLDRLDLRDAAGRVVVRQELERLGPSGDCNRADDDTYALWCRGSVEVSIKIPAPGTYTLDIVASAKQAGDERPRLTVAVQSDVEDSAGANAIRAKLVELHEKLLGVEVTPHSPDVEAAYRLFVDVWERKRASEETETWFRSLRCDWWRDIRLWDGILQDAVVEHGDEDGRRWHEYDGDHVNAFMDGIDWSDDQYTAQTWLVVLAYLMTDYRYLYL